jgi:hypothetical protein
MDTLVQVTVISGGCNGTFRFADVTDVVPAGGGGASTVSAVLVAAS